jgi:intein/homing endonuclease
MFNEHLNKIFPDPELKQYFLEYCAMLLKGGNKSKTFLVLSGHGDNGKSINMELLKLVLGKYMRILPTTVLTGKKAQSSQATPELDGINGVRHVLVQEPEGKETMNIGTLKELTGNDEIYIRGLFKEGRNILPLFKLSMTCLTGDTLVSMSNGVSYRLENLQTNNFNVLSYDINKNGLINNTINNFYNQGIKQCVELTFSDGRKIKCTPDHKFLTVNNEWVEAQNINNNEIKFGIKYVDCSDVFTECSNYKFLDYNLNNLQDKLKASALCRIIGYIITDGTLNSMLYIGHKIDVDVIQEDIKLLYGKIVYFGRNKHVWQLSLPKNIKDMINKIIPIQYGGKVRNTMCLPEFIFDDDCPKFLIREVIAGMFGGDGCIPSVNKNAISRLQLVNSKNKENLNSLITQFSKLSILLKNKFDIESYVSEPQLYDIEQEHYHVYLNIGKLDSILKFINNIGIRYCCHKSYRLTCIHSLINLKNSIIDQNNKIIERTKILVDTFRRQNVLPHIEQYNKDNTYIATFKTTQIAEHSTGIRHGEIKGACKRNGTAGGYIWKFKTFESEKLNEPGVEHFRNALQVAINELKTKGEIINEKYLITYSQLTYYIRNNISYDMPVIFNKRIFLKETGLNNFCNNLTKKVHYSVDINSNVLPTFNLKLINIKNIGLQQVYDINVEHTHNFLANGAVVHNCNALPRLPFDDPATWNRIRVLFHESTFPKDASLVPAEENEQYIKKIFPRDDFFSEKLPKMKQPMMWLMFDILGKIEKNGRMKEPEKVKKATLMYRENNDVFYQFIKEKIVEDHTENCGITLIEAFTAFREWFKNSFPNVSIPDKNDMKKDLLLKWGEIDKKTRKWLNYRLREDKDDLRDGTLIILNEQDLQQDNKIPEFKPVEFEELKLVDNDNDSYIILEEDKPMTKFKKINRLNKYIIPENEIEFEIESDSDSDIDIDTSPLKIYTHKHPQQNKFECENTSDNESESENTSDDETTLEITDESDSDTDSE